ncbi:MAG: IclR family transcriptional regulator [Litorilinea sp.]
MIGSVLKAIDVLEVFTAHEPRLSLAEISRRLGLPRSTTHNLLKTLHSRNLLEKVDSDHYALGPALIGLSPAVRVNVEIRDRSAPLLRELADACRESVYLTIPDGDQILYIYALESPRRLLARSAVGDRFPYHCTAVGKAMLAFFPPATTADILDRLGLPAMSPSTITDRGVLEAELAQTRQRGYATDAGENNPNIFCMGAPILDAQGRVVAASSISGADPEILNSRRPDLARRLVLAAEEISRRMGYVPASPSQVSYARLGDNSHLP